MLIQGVGGYWHSFIKLHQSQEYFQKLSSYLKAQQSIVNLYPPASDYFAAFRLTPFEDVSVVILGQDPYHGKAQAHGLAFSVRQGVKVPPSLRNIFKELNQDLGAPIPACGDLTKWAKNGVLLLNSILTVEEEKPCSHAKIGWETFTDSVIQTISEKKDQVVFILWGAFAQKKESLIDNTKHLIIKAPHPAAEIYQGGKAGFFGSKPFSKANDFLDEPVNWSLD